MQNPRRVFNAPTVGIGCVLLGAIALRAPLLAGGQIDYDEGVYWQSLRSLAAGHPLFASVFSSQPPAFLLLLMPPYRLMGDTIVAARVAVLVVALLGIAAAGRAAWLLAGPGAGVLAAALMAADPLLFRQSVTLQSDGPAVALGLVAIAMAAQARASSERRAVLLAAGAGAVLAIAILTKLLAVAAFPAVLVLLVGRPVNPRMVPRLFGAATLGWGVAMAALLLPFISVWSDLWAETVSFHLHARSAPLGGLDAQTYLRELPIALLGVVGFLIALRRAPMLAATVAVWAITAALGLIVQHPVWPHHAVALVAPLTVASGAITLPLTARPIGSAVTAAGAAAVVLAGSITSAAYVRALQEPAAAVEPTIAALRASTRPADLVISDDQFATALAGRSTPPELVDTSLVRVTAGHLTVDEVIAVAQRWHVRAVLLRTERLSAVPSLRAWLDQHFPDSISLGTGRTLYVR